MSLLALHLKAIFHETIHFFDQVFIGFECNGLVELSNDHLAFLDFELKLHKLFLELTDLRYESFIKIAQIFVLGKSLKLAPDSLRIFQCHQLIALGLDCI